MTGVPKLHDDEVDIDSAVVERLLAEQFPRWAGLPVRVIERSGTDNVTFRVGDDLSVRLPRTSRNQGQVEMDLTWMPRLAPYVSLPIPEPLELGRPSEVYPFTWGVYRWLPGAPFVPSADDTQAAHDLARFVRTLREVDTTGAPVPDDDPFSRGTPLAPRDAMFREALDELREHFDTARVLAAWEESLAADTWDGPPTWIHGDLMSGNLLVADGKLSAVIDFATARAADPAGDVLPAWWIFEGESRKAYREALEVDESTWLRARGWALSLVIIAIPYYMTRFPETLPNGQASVADILSPSAGVRRGAR